MHAISLVPTRTNRPIMLARSTTGLLIPYPLRLAVALGPKSRYRQLQAQLAGIPGNFLSSQRWDPQDAQKALDHHRHRRAKESPRVEHQRGNATGTYRGGN